MATKLRRVPVMLGVQVNYFTCCGVAIGVCISHVIADGAAAVGFLKAWVRFACGSPDTIETDSVVNDCGSRFPPARFIRVLQGSSVPSAFVLWVMRELPPMSIADKSARRTRTGPRLLAHRISKLYAVDMLFHDKFELLC
ncbi:hypothetical protein V6N13_015619 [Hibiscus sabdariffa]